MKSFFYPRLALSNIRKNGQTYIPYLLTSTFTVAMFYMIHSLSVNSGYVDMKIGRTMLPYIMNLGTWVVMIFSVIFLLYINSFLIKRRKKEVALYNILGMEKKHIMIMMFCETLLTSIFSLVIGLLLGVVLSRLLFLILIHLANIPTSLRYTVSIDSIHYTILLYIPIFFVSYLFNAIQIKMSNPIELLRGSQTGEKEPKVKWILTLIGFITLGAGYYIAQTIEDPAEAMLLFFVAVILVIIGTYALFTAGSIALLKILKKNKHFYYQTRHFTAVSQMIYRMKQNAVGLASICILCTCILVMLSSTVSLYIGVQDSSNMIVNENLSVVVQSSQNNSQDKQDIDDMFQKDLLQMKEQGIEVEKFVQRRIYDIIGGYQDHEFKTAGYDFGKTISLAAMDLEEFNRGYGKQESLKNDEVLIACNFDDISDSFVMNGKTFHVKKVVDEDYFLNQKHENIEKYISIVFKNESILKKELFHDNEDYYTEPMDRVSIDFKDKEMTDKAVDIIENNRIDNLDYIQIQSQYEIQSEYIQIFGSLFFLGIFLGVLFLMATILIMYYKQLSEGYEDQKRYEIMQNVGMSQKEVKQSIRSQVLIFFFLPLIVACIHMAFAFKMIVKMFSVLVVSQMSLFVWCTVISVIILTIIYSIVYSLTARTYYKIVKAG